MRKILCFGELLWDKTLEGNFPGGAPINVAINLLKNGVDTSIISRVGNDEQGESLRDFLKKNSIDDNWIQVDSKFLTGEATVNINKKTLGGFEIAFPSSWGNIEYLPDFLDAHTIYDAFLYGTLVSSGKQSKKTLLKLLEQEFKYKIYDVNFRKNFYSRQIVDTLFRFSHILKVNDEELLEIAEWYGWNQKSQDNMVKRLAEKFDMLLICVTMGEKGAKLFYDGKMYWQKGFQIQFKSAVGAGDAFLAGLLSSFFSGKPPNSSLRYANAVGAFVASKRGANPDYTVEEVLKIII